MAPMLVTENCEWLNRINEFPANNHHTRLTPCDEQTCFKGILKSPVEHKYIKESGIQDYLSVFYIQSETTTVYIIPHSHDVMSHCGLTHN